LSCLFIRNRPALAEGRGQVLTESAIDLSGKWLVIVHPGFPVDTAWAYRNCDPREERINLTELLNYKPVYWKDHIQNDFEPVVFSRYPELSGIRKLLYEAGAFYASMSGSGSSIYGLFNDAPDLSGTLQKQVTWIGQL